MFFLEFENGFIQFDNVDMSEAAAKENAGGTLPGGIYGNVTRMEFCCRDDSYQEEPSTNFPNTRPFVLMMNNRTAAKDNSQSAQPDCQVVDGNVQTKLFIFSVSSISFI